MLAVLIHGNHLPILIWRILQYWHIGMGMAAQDKVTAFGLTEEHLIAIAFDVPAEVGDSDHEVALLLFPKDVDIFLSRLCRIEIGDTLAIFIKHQSLQRRRKSEDTDLHAITH